MAKHCPVTGKPTSGQGACSCGACDPGEDEVPPDALAGVGYTRLRTGAVARTVEVTNSIMVDVDAEDRILGVETLNGEDWQAALVTLAMTGRLTVPRASNAR